MDAVAVDERALVEAERSCEIDGMSANDRRMGRDVSRLPSDVLCRALK
jgi:hypothetical protein